jgi:hypothetical protein
MEGNNCNCAPNIFEIFTGQDKDMSMRVVSQPGNLPLDLTDCTEIDVAIPNADGTFTNLLLSMSQVSITSPPIAGQFVVTITNEESILFNVGLRQNIDVALTISGLITIVRFFQAFSVLESPV